MKKVLLTLTAIAGLTFASKAQDITGFAPGNIIVEGNLGFNTSDNKNTEVKTTGFSFNPQVGYFLTNKFALGLYANVGSENTDKYAEGVDTQNKSSNFGIGAFGRYYFLELGSRFKTYAELGAGYNQENDKVVTPAGTTEDPKVSGFGINGSLGANFFLTDKIAINYKFANVIGFNSSKIDVDGAKATSNFSLNVNKFNNFFTSGQFGLTFKF